MTLESTLPFCVSSGLLNLPPIPCFFSLFHANRTKNQVLHLQFAFYSLNGRMAITRRQKEVIDFLSGFTQKNGYSPSYEEIAAGLGLNSLATVHKHITNLQNKGLLQRAHNRSRSIDVLPPRPRKKGFERLPLLGRIAAGQPVEAIETAESISLGDIIGNREVFALEVRGDSMRDEHIVSGDYVLVERTRTAREGEIVVALIDGADATLKRFYREGNMIRLQPSNAEMAPIYAPRPTSASRARCWACCESTRFCNVPCESPA